MLKVIIIDLNLRRYFFPIQMMKLSIFLFDNDYTQSFIYKKIIKETEHATDN